MTKDPEERLEKLARNWRTEEEISEKWKLLKLKNTMEFLTED